MKFKISSAMILIIAEKLKNSKALVVQRDI